MNNFLEQMAEILEVDSVETKDILTEFEMWDSLSILSIIALTDAEYGVTISAAEVKEAGTIGGIQELINSKK